MKFIKNISIDIETAMCPCMKCTSGLRVFSWSFVGASHDALCFECSSAAPCNESVLLVCELKSSTSVDQQAIDLCKKEKRDTFDHSKVEIPTLCAVDL